MVSGQWLTVQDVAELLQVRIETVRRWVRQGELPVLELGGHRTVYRIRPEDLDEFVWRRYRSAGSDSDQDAPDDPPASSTDIPDVPLLAEDTPAHQGESPTVPGLSALAGGDVRAIVDRVPAVTFREDPQRHGAPLYMSREIEMLLGFPVEEWSNDPEFWMQHVHPMDREAVAAELERTDSTGEPFKMEYRMLARDGGLKWVQVDAWLVADATNASSVWEGVIVDVTERKRIERALGLRERQQRAVADLGRQALEGRALTDLLTQTVRHVTESLDVEHAKVFEVLPGGDSLVLRSSIGWMEGQIGRTLALSGDTSQKTITAVDSQADYTLSLQQPVIAENLETEQRFDGPGMVEKHGVRSGLSLTIPGRGRPFGVLGAHSTQIRSFSQEDVFFLQSISNMLASAVARQDQNWLTVTEVAEFLQVTEETVRRWIRRSELPALNLGGPRAGYRVFPSDLERFIGDRVIRY